MGRWSDSRAKGHNRHVTDFGAATKREEDLMVCVHCDVTWVVRPGSGTHRGWCFNCNGPTCGRQLCVPCIPFIKRMEIMAASMEFAKAVGLQR